MQNSERPPPASAAGVFYASGGAYGHLIYFTELDPDGHGDAGRYSNRGRGRFGILFPRMERGTGDPARAHGY